MLRSIIFVALGGALGSIARYIISMVISENNNIVFPLQTLTVNIAGCLILGFINGIIPQEHAYNNNLRLFLTVGFCGGFTTFSTYCSENLSLLRNGHFLIGSLYASACVFMGLAAVYAGTIIAQTISNKI